MSSPTPLGSLFARLERRDVLTFEERGILASAASQVKVVHAGEDIVRESDRPTSSVLLARGFSGRHKVMQDGSRQITAFHIDGDFVDLHGFLLKTMDHGVRALSDCVLVTFPHQELRKITEEQPHLTRILWLSTLLDSAIVREWVIVRGRLLAISQMAHLFCELLERWRVVGDPDARSFSFPITQADLGDALGMSSVHVNRTIQEIRARGLAEWRDGIVEVFEEQRLRALGVFNREYLHLEKEPR